MTSTPALSSASYIGCTVSIPIVSRYGHHAKSGWWKYATVHGNSLFGCSARSCWSQAYIEEPGPQPFVWIGFVEMGTPRPRSGFHVVPLHAWEFSAMKCQPPRL